MSEEQKTDTPDTSGAPNQGAKVDAQGTNPETGKTFTEAEVNAMMTARLAKQEKALKAQFEAESKKAAERAKLDETERIQAEKADLEQKLQQLEAEKAEAVQRASLAGKVSDVDYALFKARQDTDKYVTPDGAINVDALLKDHATLAVQPDPKPGPAPTAGGGSGAKGADMNSFIRQAAGRK